MRPLLFAVVLSIACSSVQSQMSAGGGAGGGHHASGGGSHAGGGNATTDGGGEASVGGGQAATGGGVTGGGSGGSAGSGGGSGGSGGSGGLPANAASFDVVVVGAGTGGTAAAVQAARMGARVALLEPTPFVGGQAIAAGVTSMDESVAGERSYGLYKEWISLISEHYQALGKSIGTCYWSSATAAFEPHVGEAQLRYLLADAGVTLATTAQVTQVYRSGSSVIGVGLADGGAIASRVLIDATEYGDLLLLAQVPYRVGAATSAAPDAGACVQDITYLAVMRKYAGGVPAALQLSQKPPGYDAEAALFARVITADGGNWYAGWGVYPTDFASHNAYRGMPDTAMPGSPTADTYAGAQTLTRTGVNWANDYPAQVIVNPPPDAGRLARLSSSFTEDAAFRAQAQCEAKLRTLSFLYYVQHDLGEPSWSIADDEGYAAAFDGGCPNIPAVFKPIEQHFPPIPYVREGRRMVGLYTLTGADLRGRDDGGTPRLFKTSLAICGYPDDLHNCNTDDTLEAPESRADITNNGRFEVPFESFIPQTVDGFVAAEKNLSQTRLVNGATRLQPSTMMTGQAAGAIAALAARHGVAPRAVSVAQVQDALARSDVQIAWHVFSDVPHGTPGWSDVQLMAARQILLGYGNGVFGAADPMTRGQAAVLIARTFGLDTSMPPATPSFADVPTSHFAYAYVEALKAAGYPGGCDAGVFCPDDPLQRAQLASFMAKGLQLNLSAVSVTPRFVDVPTTTPGFAAVQAVSDAGVMGACAMGPTFFCPAQTVTRLEAAGVARAALVFGN